MILPLFMLGLLALVSVLFMTNVRQKVQASLLMISEDLSVRLADGLSIPMSEIEDELTESLTNEDFKYIENGRNGFDMSGSDIDNGEYIALTVSFDLVPLTGRFGILHIPCCLNSFEHIWCGYEDPYFPDEVYVYITDESEVYHLDRECSHIRLSVRETTPDAVSFLRNSNGARYRSCELCHAKMTDARLFVSEDGDRYHNSITCSGLKRTVRAVKISEVGDRRPCSRCGR